MSDIRYQVDRLRWTPSLSGNLSLKDAYVLQAPSGTQLGWAKFINIFRC